GEVEEVREQVTVTQEVTKEGKPKKTTKKKVIKRKGKEQQVTEIVTVEEQGKRPVTTVTEGPVEEVVDEVVKPLPAPEYVKPSEVEEVREQVTVTQEITREGKPKKTTKKKIIKRKGKEQQVTEILTVEEQGKVPVTTVTEGPVEEVVEDVMKPLPTPEFVKPSEVEEVREQVTVTEEVTREGKPKKVTKKKVIKRKGKEQQVTEVVTVEEQGKAPVTTVTEGPVEELVEEIIKPLPAPERIKPTEVEEVREQVTVTEEVTKEGKPKKTVKKKIIKRKGKDQQVTEVVTVEEQGKAPVTTVTEGPLEEVVDEAVKSLPVPEYAKPGEVEEVREQVTVTQEITKEGKPKKTTKKKVIKRKGKEQQVTEIVTVEEQGKRPVTTVTEGPTEEVVDEVVKPLPMLEYVQPSEVEEVREQVTVTEEITKEGKPKKTTKKKVIKRKGKEQQVTEVVTVEEQGKRPVTTVTEGPIEEVVDE
ncbi:PREDICTED: titin-like, partial [Habropoda laboriosa]|uniref:titin-like n=1 Tax=Habropoda laboriosa TaxID=597456 RepID=UPI00083E39B2